MLAFIHARYISVCSRPETHHVIQQWSL